MSSRFREVWHHSPMHSLLAVAAATVLACGGESGRIIDPPLDPAVRLSISPSGLRLIVGDEGFLTARADDSKGRMIDASFEWSSADPTIASVGKRDGSVIAIAVGTTTVTATAGALSATASVSVRPPDPPVAVSISPSALTLIAGDVERLTARATDSDGRTTSA